MKKFFLLAFCSLSIPLWAPGARAQQAPLVVATCGTQSLTPGASAREYIDVTGNLCSSATGGGGGGGAVTIAEGADVTEGTRADGAYAGSGNCTVIGCSKGLYNLINGNLLPTGTAGAPSSTLLTVQGIAAMTPLQTQQSNYYPVGSTPITISATGTTAATTATLAANATLKTYICGLSVRANATAAVTGDATVTGTVTGTLHFTQWTAPNASGIGINEQVFVPCVPSSATNTAIAIVSAAPGTGGVVSVTGWGYQAP